MTPLTAADVLKEYDHPLNPYWLACHIALGRKPETWEFTAWINGRWNAFAESLGLKDGAAGVRRQHGAKAHEMFCEYLGVTP